MSLFTELQAVRDALVAGDRTAPAALTVGCDPFQMVDTALHGAADLRRQLKEIKRQLNGTAAETALDTAIATLG